MKTRHSTLVAAHRLTVDQAAAHIERVQALVLRQGEAARPASDSLCAHHLAATPVAADIDAVDAKARKNIGVSVRGTTAALHPRRRAF